MLVRRRFSATHARAHASSNQPSKETASSSAALLAQQAGAQEGLFPSWAHTNNKQPNNPTQLPTHELAPPRGSASRPAAAAAAAHSCGAWCRRLEPLRLVSSKERFCLSERAQRLSERCAVDGVPGHHIRSHQARFPISQHQKVVKSRPVGDCRPPHLGVNLADGEQHRANNAPGFCHD